MTECRLQQSSVDCPMHCLQVSLDAEHIRNEKVKVLHCMKQLTLDDVVVGQYRGRQGKGHSYPGYLDDDTVPPGRSALRFSGCCWSCSSPYHLTLTTQRTCMFGLWRRSHMA